MLSFSSNGMASNSSILQSGHKLQKVSSSYKGTGVLKTLFYVLKLSASHCRLMKCIVVKV